MSDSAGPALGGDRSAIATAESKLDLALLAFNRHAILTERYRSVVQQLPDSQQRGARGDVERATLRQARETAMVDRNAVRAAVGELVRVLRESGAPPEATLIAVKRRISQCITAMTPDAPHFDAASLKSDVGSWTIRAYYDQPGPAK